jgi:hypothetical protein
MCIGSDPDGDIETIIKTLIFIFTVILPVMIKCIICYYNNETDDEHYGDDDDDDE